MFEQVTIIGCGLIGSSILRRLKKNGEIKKLITYDNNKSVSEIIEKEGLSDQVVHSPIDAVKNSDLVLHNNSIYFCEIKIIFLYIITWVASPKASTTNNKI